MSEIKLKPCPFCGGSGIRIEPVNKWRKSLFCQNCHAKFIGESEEKLIEKWNTRKPMERIVEQLEELRDKAEYGVEHGRGILIKEPFTPYNKAIEIVQKGDAE